MAILSTRTKVRAARTAVVVPAKAAYRMPHVRSRRQTVALPVPELRLTSGPRVELPLPHVALPHRRRERRQREAIASLVASAARAAERATTGRARSDHRGRDAARAVAVAAAAGGTTAVAVHLLDRRGGTTAA